MIALERPAEGSGACRGDDGRRRERSEVERQRIGLSPSGERHQDRERQIGADR
jgi:hypothetical protein